MYKTICNRNIVYIYVALKEIIILNKDMLYLIKINTPLPRANLYTMY